MDRAFVDSRRSTKATWCCSRIMRTAFVDPFCDVPTLSVVCTVHEPVTLEAVLARSPAGGAASRGVSAYAPASPRPATGAQRSSFTSSTASSFDQTSHSGYYFIDSDEGIWNSGRTAQPNLAYRPRTKEGYFPVPPMDKLQDLRSEMVDNLLAAGVDVEAHHHEVGTAGQSEIDMRFGT